MKKILVVVGPTATGKSDLAIKLAKIFNGEIISCDSMQIYRHMDIGTAKPAVEDMDGIPHHMIDIVDPYDNFSCSDYAAMARGCISDIICHGKLPVLCGGTGLYADSVINNKFPDYDDHTDINEIRNMLDLKSSEDLYSELIKIDSAAAEKIHLNNKKRLVRALEIYYLTNRTKSEWDKISKLDVKEYDPVYIGINCIERKLLYERINKRVDSMIAEGLVEEVKNLDIIKLMGSTAGQAIGYKEIVKYLLNETTLDEAIEDIKLNTRRYAKRQITWFKRNKEINWYYIDKYDCDDFNKNDFLYKEIVNNLENILT